MQKKNKEILIIETDCSIKKDTRKKGIIKSRKQQ